MADVSKTSGLKAFGTYKILLQKGYSRKAIHALLLKFVEADIKRQAAKKQPGETCSANIKK